MELKNKIFIWTFSNTSILNTGKYKRPINQLQSLLCSLESNYCVSVQETTEKYSPWGFFFVSCSSFGTFTQYFLRIASAFKKKLRINFAIESREQDDCDCEDEQKESEKEKFEEKLTTKEITEALLQGNVTIEVPSQVHIVRIFTSSTFTGIYFA